ncbi:putative glycoside hydrolase family 16 protein [Lyophyllum shimeji]|uniref:Glycoside hydrolase family 16 protein n=1 Tax=Lyophyllum shimeji TaxID=47721 RepID=A0A9P3PJK4_LYOSH|nr:putative glycoside hydrolase family 16 protein [Lyophyllum shimeji]
MMRTLALTALALSHTTITRAYRIKDTYRGQDFFNRWWWETFDDPTHGRVNYVDIRAAQMANLSYASDDRFIMRADAYQVVPPNGRGRDSVRITSHDAWGDSLVVLDLSHMPVGCTVWPAFWTLSSAGTWPKGGEIDIIEGVHMNTANLASLHTTTGCSMSEPRGQKGQTVSADCDANVNYNQGCGTSFSSPNSYGTGFNDAGGGWYVLERSSTQGISVWFWSRTDDSVPTSVSHGLGTIYPDPSWGPPEAHFSVDSCAHETFFNDTHQMIFDITFCGDWAGTSFGTAGCGPGECNDFVDKNPDRFRDAYWEINSLHVYVP